MDEQNDVVMGDEVVEETPAEAPMEGEVAPAPEEMPAEETGEEAA